MDYDTNEEIRNIWLAGAKWQAERMYSEEDMKTLFAKTLESSPSTDSHTRMISDTEYRHFVMDEMYNRIIKSLQQTEWQAERMYSEEEVESIWKFALYSAEQHDKFGTKNKSNFIRKDVEEFIEQFKKK